MGEAVADSDEKICPDCAETIKNAAKVCRYCGYRFETVNKADDAAKTPETKPEGDSPLHKQPVQSDAQSRLLTSERTFSETTFGYLALLSFIILGAGIVWYYSYFVKDAVASSSKPAQVSVESRGPSEIDAVSVCDMAVKRSLVSENSYAPAFRWKFIADGTIGIVKRKFESTNGFGGKLTSRYECKWDSKEDSIISLVIVGPYGEATRLR